MKPAEEMTDAEITAELDRILGETNPPVVFVTSTPAPVPDAFREAWSKALVAHPSENPVFDRVERDVFGLIQARTEAVKSEIREWSKQNAQRYFFGGDVDVLKVQGNGPSARDVRGDDAAAVPGVRRDRRHFLACRGGAACDCDGYLEAGPGRAAAADALSDELLGELLESCDRGDYLAGVSVRQPPTKWIKPEVVRASTRAARRKS